MYSKEKRRNVTPSVTGINVRSLRKQKRTIAESSGCINSGLERFANEIAKMSGRRKFFSPA
jgi:hypothetical protein